MFCKLISATLNGLEAIICNVEIDCGKGIPTFNMVGMLSSENKEAKSRVKIAIKNSGFTFENKKITVNISPANLKKNGTALDLPICIGLLSNMGHIKRFISNKNFFVGEIGLNGSINKINGILPMLSAAKKYGCEVCFIPKENLYEASLIKDIKIIGVSSLNEIVKKINSNDLTATIPEKFFYKKENMTNKFSEILSQDKAIRSAIIACAGKHNIIFSGSYGIGKTLISKAMLSALPEMTSDEIIEVNEIYSSIGKNTKELIFSRPIRSPHYTISSSSLLGGGKIPVCGEITLAHKGILFLDEIGQFKKSTLNQLRQPLEDKKIVIVRNNSSVTFPADFMLIGTMNSCPCGEYPNKNKCICTENEIKQYHNKISSPILDRIDLLIHMDSPNENKKTQYNDNDIKKIIVDSWKVQKIRNFGKLNSQLTLKEILDIGLFKTDSINSINNIFNALSLSMRGYARVLKIARTIADMDNSKFVHTTHINEAIFNERVRQW